MGQHSKRSRTCTVMSAAAAGAVLGTAAAGAGIAGAAAAPSPPAPPESLVTHAMLDARVTPAVPARGTARASTAASYTVRQGDFLSSIAAARCGSAARWVNLYGANEKVVGPDPNLIYPGEQIRLACHAAAAVFSQPASPATVTAARTSVPQQPAQPAAAVTGVSGGTLGCGGLEALWEAAGGPAYEAQMAASIGMAESAGQQYAYNPSGASGYFQILGEVVPGNVFDPLVNAENAVAKWEAEGDSFYPAWTTAGEAAADPQC